MKSSAAGAIAATIFRTTAGSCRKCCPNLLRGRCELDGKLDGLDEAPGIRLALPAISSAVP